MFKIKNIINRIKNEYKKKKKSTLIIYLILRILIIVSMISQLILKNYYNSFLCIFTLLLFTLPDFLKDKFKISLPSVLEIIIYIFIYAAEILGEINHFYEIIPFWDIILHTINGFVCAGIGFSLFNILSNENRNLILSPFYTAIVAFCFSMSVGAVWELFEYGCDKYLNYDMQKDEIITTVASVKLNNELSQVPYTMNDIKKTEIYYDDTSFIINGGYLDIGINDTMEDLFVNFIGALFFSTGGYFYLKHQFNNDFVKNFIPKREIE